MTGLGDSMRTGAWAFHSFTFEGKRILFDSNTGYLYDVDEQTERMMAEDIDGGDELGDQRKQLRNRIEGMIKLSELSRVLISSSKEQNRERKISSLMLDLSHVCNMKCIYCFAEGGNYGGKEELMDVATVERSVDLLIDNIDERRSGHIVFFGGEPMVNFPMLQHCIVYANKRAKEKNIAISFQLATNGTIFNHEQISFLQKHDVTIQVSLDGPSKLHDQLRPFRNGKGSYDVVQKNLRLLSQKGKNNIMIRSTITHLNPHVASIYGFFYEKGFTHVEFGPVKGDEGNCTLTRDDIEIIRNQFRLMAEDIIGRIRRNEEGVRLGPFSFSIYLLNTGQVMYHYCGAGTHFLTVTPDGRLFPCEYLISRPEYVVGSVQSGLDTSLLMKRWSLDPVDEKVTCEHCWARYLCGGGCAAEAIAHRGSSSLVDETFCEYIKAKIENALRIHYFLSKLPKDEVFIDFQNRSTAVIEFQSKRFPSRSYQGPN